MRPLRLLLLSVLLAACSPARPVVVDSDKIILKARPIDIWSLSSLFPRATYMINTDGSGESAGRSPWALDDQPEWSPDGQWIAYDTAFSDYHNSALYVMRSDGSRRTRLEASGSDPTWSPDGTRIAYTIGNKIYILDVGCVLRQEKKCDLTPTFLTEGYNPDWSPDGKRIIYEQYRPSHIYVINADGIDPPVDLTPNMLNCGAPKWSPDGTKIVAFCLMTMELKVYEWSPDGTEIFTARLLVRDIFVMNADGSNLINLTNDQGPHVRPSWSPDGSKIAFMSLLFDKKPAWGASGPTIPDAIFLMNADGTNRVRISPRDDEMIIWYTWYPAGFKTRSP